jgi:hypothetical protein
MVKLREILLVLFMTMFIGCSTAQPNPNSYDDNIYEYPDSDIELGQDTILLNNEITCSECDSLYNNICPERPEIFGGPEKLPSFPGGERAMMKFLVENLKCPSECIEMGIQGRVIVRFIISETGKIISNSEVKKLKRALPFLQQ